MEHGPFKWLRTKSLVFPEYDVAKPDELVHDEPFENYISDRLTINNSGLKKIIQSPRHYISWLAGLGEEEGPEKDHFRIGRAAHMMILEPDKFRSCYVAMPEFTGLTKDGRESKQSAAAKEKRDAWYADLPPGSLVLSDSEMEDLTCMIDSLMEHPQASNLLKNGRPEVTGRFTDKETGLRVRIRPDYLTWDANGAMFVTDIKTTRDASAGLFSTDAGRMKYPMQLALYRDGVAQITKQEPEAVAFIVLEKKPPYSAAIYWLDDEDLAIGRQWYKYSLMTLRRCLDTNEWPSVQGEGQMLKMPGWTKTELFPSFEWSKPWALGK